MSKSKITLSLDDLAIDAGKAYATKSGLTLDKLVNQLNRAGNLGDSVV